MNESEKGHFPIKVPLPLFALWKSATMDWYVFIFIVSFGLSILLILLRWGLFLTSFQVLFKVALFSIVLSNLDIKTFYCLN